MRNSLRAGLLVAAAGIVAGAGCGDGPICPSEVVVVIQSPAGGSTITSAHDEGPDAPGIQVDVSARSTLHDTAFTLTVTDASGAVATFDATSNDDGDVTFTGVTVPAGQVTLAVTGTGGECGTGSDQVEVTVVTEAECMLSIDEGPIESDFYAPLPVLNASNDSDPDLPNFQAHSTVQTAPGFEVELFVLDVGAGSEASLGTMVADDSGEVRFDYTLAQGLQAVRATCVRSSVNEASATHTVFVDTVAPTCSLDVPAEGATIIPADDQDGDADNGIQFTWTATVDAGDSDDVEGEATTFFRNGLEFEGTPVAADGSAQTAELAGFTAPGTIPVGFESSDHAGNECADGHDVTVELEGCSVVIEQPMNLVLEDADGDADNGLQTAVIALIGTECAGQTATAECGFASVDLEVPGDGRVTFDAVTLAEEAMAQGSTTCTVSVTDGDGIVTSDAVTVDYDTENPALTASAPDRQSIEASWLEFGGAGDTYMLRYATDPFTDFESEGTEVEGVGTSTSATIEMLDAGQTYYLGVAAVDGDGNVGEAFTIGPIIPVLDATGAVTPANAGDGDDKGFGLSIAGGDFNGDGFADVAVAAPYTGAGAGTVYVYFGSATGVDTSAPAVTIEGAGQFGYGLTAIQWGDDAVDDLAIGAPFLDGLDGGVFIFDDATLVGAAGGAALTTADADATIRPDATTPGWFGTSALGWSLAAGQIDAAGTGEDLAIGAPNGGAGEGGVVIVYGGSGADAIVLSSDAGVANLDGAGAHLLTNPFPATENLFGVTVSYLGDTRAGDGVGDIGIAYFNDRDAEAASPVPDRAFVLRGRTTVPDNALESITLGSSDLVLELQSADTTTAFGEGLGSIADQNADGFRDIVVTAFRFGVNRGRAWIVDGSLTSSTAAPAIIVPGTSGFLTQIAGTADTGQFATGYANNAAAPAAADVDADGIEDLLLTNGTDADTSLLVWYGDAIPTGAVSADTAAYVIAGPAAFTNTFSVGQPGGLAVSWIGDVNNDGLSDICWGDYEANGSGPDGSYETEGRIEILWDE